jgi:hypothetical protein
MVVMRLERPSVFKLDFFHLSHCPKLKQIAYIGTWKTLHECSNLGFFKKFLGASTWNQICEGTEVVSSKML